MAERISNLKKRINIENVVPVILFIISSISVLTSIGIVLTLLVDAAHFFAEIPFTEVFSTKLEPLRAKIHPLVLCPSSWVRL